MSLRLPSAETVPTGDFEGAIKLGDRGEHTVFWHPQTNSVAHFTEEQIKTGTTDMVTYLTDPVGDYLNESDRCGKCWTFSKLGQFFRNTSSFEDIKLLTYREEMVYGIYRCTDYTNEEGAEMLDISLNVYEGHLKRAQQKVTCAFNLVDAVIQ